MFPDLAEVVSLRTFFPRFRNLMISATTQCPAKRWFTASSAGSLFAPVSSTGIASRTGRFIIENVLVSARRFAPIACLLLLFGGLGITASQAEDQVKQEDVKQPKAKEEPAKQEQPKQDLPEPVETLEKTSDPANEATPEEKTSEEKGAEEEAPPEKTDAQADAPKPKPKAGLTERILEGLSGEGKIQAGNPLDPIVERMRSAQQKLQKSETDKETRELQSRIVKDLDELIEKLKNQKPPPSKSNSNSNPPPPPMGENDPNMPPRGSPQPKPQNSQKQQGGAEQKSQPSETGKSPEKSRQSTNQSQGQPRSPEEEAARQRLAKDVWGHLPPALRQQLLNVYSEKFLPKYDDMVRKYYEALAEQNRKNP